MVTGDDTVIFILSSYRKIPCADEGGTTGGGRENYGTGTRGLQVQKNTGINKIQFIVMLKRSCH